MQKYTAIVEFEVEPSDIIDAVHFVIATENRFDGTAIHIKRITLTEKIHSITKEES